MGPLWETCGWMELLHLTQQTANGNDVCVLSAWLSQAMGSGCRGFYGEGVISATWHQVS